MANDRIRIEVTGDSSDLQAAMARSRESIRSVGDESEQQTGRAQRSWTRLRTALARPIRGRVDMDTRNVDAGANRVTRAWNQMRSRLRPITVTARANVADARAGLGSLADDLNRFRNTRATANADVRVTGGQRLRAFLAQARADLARIGQGSASARPGVEGLNTTIGRLNQRVSLLRTAIRAMAWTALVAGAGIAIQALSTLAAGAVALTSALAPLSGTLIALPGFMGAIAQASGVWSLATGGLKEAVGGLNEKLNTSSKAFKALSPEGQRFARTLQRLKPELRSVQQSAQRGLFPGLREGITAAVRNLPVVERVVGRTARAMGQLAASAGRALGSREWGRDLESIGNTNVVIMTRLGRAAGNVANALRDIGVAAGPTLRALAGDVVTLTGNLSRAARQGRESGRLAAYFERSRQVLNQVVRIGADLVSTLGNIGRAAQPSGQRLLNSFGETAERWRAWTASMRGQNALRDYFDRAEPNVRALGSLLARISLAFTRIGAAPGFARTITAIRDRLIPALERAITTITRVAGPDIVNALASLADLFAALSPYVATVARVIATLVGGLADLVRQQPAVGVLIASLMGLKALSFVGTITGLNTLVGALLGLGGPIDGAKGKWAGLVRLLRSPIGKLGIAGLGAELALQIPIVERFARSFRDLKGSAMGDNPVSAFAESLKPVKPNLEGAIGGLDRFRGRMQGIANGMKASDVNMGRWFNRVPQIVPRAEQAVGRFARAYGSIPAVRDFLLRARDEQAVARIARLSNRLTDLGGQDWVARIMARGDLTVRQKIDLLRRKLREYQRTRAQAEALLRDRATPKLRNINRFPLRDKKLAAKAFDEATPKLRNINRFGLPDKSLAAKAFDQATPKLRDIRSFGLPGKTQVVKPEAESVWDTIRSLARTTLAPIVQWIVTRRRRAEGGPVLGGYAQGGEPIPAASFAGAPTRRSMGGRFSRPTYLVGEENRPEFVIATNPRYRKANLQYLRMAAGALGVTPGFAGGGSVDAGKWWDKYQSPYGKTVPGPPPGWRGGFPGGAGMRRAEDGSWVGPGYGGGRGGGGSKFLSFSVTAGFAKGGALGSFDAEDRAGFRYRAGTIAGARERMRFFETLQRGRGGRSSREWYAMSRKERYRINDYWEGRREKVDALQEAWATLFGQRSLGRRAQQAQFAVMRGFRREFAGQFAQGGRVRSTGLARVHRGEHISPAPDGPYGSQLRPQVPAPVIQLTFADKSGELVRLIDARVDGRAAQATSRTVGRKTRRVGSAPGASRGRPAR